MLLNLLIVGCGGFIGAVLRFTLSDYIHNMLDNRFPYGTFAVNIIGSFLLGFMMYMIQTKGYFTPETRTFITIGLLGAFTTYSTFAFESYQLIIGQRYLAATVNITIQLFIGLVAISGAVVMAKSIFK